MTIFTWSLGGSGAWGTASNWGTSTSGLPGSLDTVNIVTPGAQVSIDAGVSAFAYTLTTSGSSLLLDGGTLTTVHHATLYGAYTQTSGTYTMSGTGATFYGKTWFAGGAVNITTGSLQIESGATFGGGSAGGTATAMTMAGTGVLELAGGQSYFDAGFTCKLNAIVLDYGARLGFNTSFVLGRNVTSNGGSVDLFGHTLTLNGTSLFSGVLGDGVINDAGTLTLGSTLYALSLNNGAVLNVLGTAIQANTLYDGSADGGGQIVIGKAAQYDINGNWTIYDPSTAGSITNRGIFAKTGGGKTAQVNVSLTSQGTLSAGIGELQLNGLVNAISGTVSGAGTLGIAGGQTTLIGNVALGCTAITQHSGLLVLNSAESYAKLWQMTGGVLNLNQAHAVLTLTGNDSFDGGSITGYGGTLNLNGTTELANVMLGGPNHYNFNGTVDQTGTVTFGLSSNPLGVIAAGATWLVEGDSSIQGTYGLLINKGTFSDPNGSGNAQVFCELSSTGTVAANNSTLTLAGTNWLGGTLTGSGLIDLAGTTTLQSGLVLAVADLDISNDTVLAANLGDAGAFTEYYLGAIDLAGHTLSLSGTVALEAGTMSDGGTIACTGPTTLGSYNGGYTITGASELLVKGHADQINSLYLQNASGSGTLAIAAGANYAVLDDLYIYGAGQVSVGGTLTESGTGTAGLAPALTLASGGALVLNDQLLTLGGGGTLGGTISGGGTLDLAVGTFALAAGMSALSAGLELTGGAVAVLGANQHYAGDFQTSGGTTLALSGDTLTLSGTAELMQGSISGQGTVSTSGATTIGAINLPDSSTLLVTGVAEQIGTMQLGSTSGVPSSAQLVIATGGQYTLDGGASIVGDGTLVVSGGTFTANGDGYSVIQTAIVDTGTIAANLGTLSVQGSVTATGPGTGSFSIGSAGFLDFSNTATISLFTYVTFNGAGGQLRIDDLANFGATLQNFATGDAVLITGLSTQSLSETFANAAHTALLISDGAGDQITLQFSTAQTLSALSLGANSQGIATLTHH